MTYKTPGVYVEEISVFPPSVAEVETAIPAFIGYTERVKYQGVDYTQTPVEISSLVDFQAWFGVGPAVDVDAVKLDATNTVIGVETRTNYNLYDSLRLFFANGGGRCYVASCGAYKGDKSVDKAEFTHCLNAIAKEDEPTMILFPDAINLDSNAFYTLQQEALAQAGNLGDRFVVMDLQTQGGSLTGAADWEGFRNGIGMKSLKYGAAYMPYLKVSLDKTVAYRDFYTKIEKNGLPMAATEFSAADDDTHNLIAHLNQLISESGNLDGLTAASVKATYDAHIADANGAGSPTTRRAHIKSALASLYVALKQLETLAETDHSAYGLLGGEVPTVANNLAVKTVSLLQGISASVASLNGINDEASTDIQEDANGYFADPAMNWDPTVWGGNISQAAPGQDDIDNNASLTDKLTVLQGRIAAVAPHIISVYGEAEAMVASLETSLQNSVFESAPVLKNIARKLSSEESILPPSGAVAGAYADTDNKRGVWKAPANVSLSGVVGLTEKIDNDDQERLNVDTIAGKSVNAIREFAGRGTMIWGARTLAGNDNEWRYVPVRRFYNMVEESVRKSTSWAVFEPNDANLWTKLKAMIENYLTQKWREGALTGAKPEHAFFVNVGLGKTMSAQDILEGRLIIEIGMAAVKPAEFIVLRFSHKMQES